MMLVCGAPLAATAQNTTGSAPADEYFGRLGRSILEIRNRLDRLDAQTEQRMRDGDVLHEIDEVQGSMVDWQAQYPNDPWLPHMLGRLLRQYHRAGASESPKARSVFAIMRRSYPQSAETARAVALYGGAVPVQAAPGVWAHFDESRGPAGP